MEALCDAAAKYGIEVLPILNGNVALKSDGTYTSGSGFPSQEDVENKFNIYVKKLLNEPKLKAVATGVEIWNEPDITPSQGGVYLQDSELAEKGETAFAASFGDCPWAKELTENDLQAMFHFIQVDWNSGEI